MDAKEIICRICLKIPKFGYIIDDSTMLDVLLIKLKLGVDEDVVICRSCTLIIRKLCNFKLACINTEIINCDLNNDHAEKLINVCRLCQDKVNKDDSIALEMLLNRPMNQDLLQVFMPEIVTVLFCEFYSAVSNKFDHGRNSELCRPCQENLEIYLQLIQKYLTTEGKINTFLENGFNKGTLLRQLHKYSDTTVGVNENQNNYVNFILTKLLEKRTNSTQAVEEIIYINPSGTVMFKCPLCAYETKRQFYFKKHALLHNSTHDKNNSPITHKNKSSSKQYKCSQCTFKTNWINSLKNHLLSHTILTKEKSSFKLYKCPQCPFRTNWKHNFKTHQFRHNTAHSDTVSDPKGTIYRCTNCTYETTCKEDITQHLVVHRNQLQYKDKTSDVSKTLQSIYKTKNSVSVSNPQSATYKWINCTCETTYKEDITQNLVVHEGQLQETMFEDESSEFYKTLQPIQSSSDPQGTTYKCTNCTYETMCKGDITQHLVDHKGQVEKTMYEDESSESSKTLQSIYKTRKSVAVSDPQGTTYKCMNCTYETTCKEDITQHLVVHENQPVRTMYKRGGPGSSKTKESSLKTTTSCTTVSDAEVTTYMRTNETTCKKDTAQRLIAHKTPIQESVSEGEDSQSSSSKGVKRSRLTVNMKRMIMRVFNCLLRDYPSLKDTIVDTCSDYTGVSKATVYKILREDRMYGEVRPPRLSTGRKPIEIDEDAKYAIGQIVESFYVANDQPTLDKILKSAKKNRVIPKMSRDTLRKTLISMDLNYWKK